MTDNPYNPRARETKAFEERMSLTSFKAKSIEMLVRAEMSVTPEQGTHYATIAQAYATLELARVTAAQKPRK
jgi:hypothetical protein